MFLYRILDALHQLESMWDVYKLHRITGLKYSEIDSRKVTSLLKGLQEYERHKESGQSLLSHSPEELKNAIVRGITTHSLYSGRITPAEFISGELAYAPIRNISADDAFKNWLPDELRGAWKREEETKFLNTSEVRNYIKRRDEPKSPKRAEE